MEYYSAVKKKKNAFESVLMRWMKLEPIIQSEISQKGKYQYSILTHIYGIYLYSAGIYLYSAANLFIFTHTHTHTHTHTYIQ